MGMGQPQLAARSAAGMLALAIWAGASDDVMAAASTPCPAAAAACAKDTSCHAYGVYGASFQLHGCADAKALVPNSDWSIYVPTDATKHAFKPLGKKVNVDEAKCAMHPMSAGGHCQSSPSPAPPHAPPHGHPVPAPTPRPYDSIGSIDVGTLENTIFWWRNKTYVLENIGCNYIDHAGKWFPEYANHSYARVRDFTTGTVVANISSSIGFGFLNAFPDYDHGRLWLFGTPADRCHGNCGACSGASCPGRPSCTSIQSWWTSESIPTSFDTAVAIPAGTKDLPHTFNQGVSRVRVPGPGMPPHRYVMISEGDRFFINNDPDGNLTAAGAGWTYPKQHPHPGGSGGVSMQWAPAADPTKPGWYYTVTGGSSVGFARSHNLQTWEGGYHVAMSNQADQQHRGEYQIAPYNGFPESATRKGFAAMAAPANWTKWGYDNNDGDVCCADQDAAEKQGHGRSPHGWLVWGASTQGSPCGIVRADGVQTCSTNAVGRFDASKMSLAELMASFFE